MPGLEPGIASSSGSHQKETYVEIEKVRHETGESLIAMGEKIREVELFCRDTYAAR